MLSGVCRETLFQDLTAGSLRPQLSRKSRPLRSDDFFFCDVVSGGRAVGAYNRQGKKRDKQIRLLEGLVAMIIRATKSELLNGANCLNRGENPTGGQG